jgi:hypothetical protein
MRFRQIEADFFEAADADNYELWQVEPMTWKERFQQAWDVFAYPSRRMVLVICKRGMVDKFAEAQ